MNARELHAKEFTMYLYAFVACAITWQLAFGQNMLRFACSQLTVERADPLVTPGMNPAPHTNQIIGGNSFNLTVRDTTIRLLKGWHNADGASQIRPSLQVHMHKLYIL